MIKSSKFKISVLFVLVFVLASVLVVCLSGCNSNSADTMYYGKIHTEDGENTVVEAMGVKNGKICFTGTKDDAAKYVGSNTDVQDLGDKMILPGFIDGHTHIHTDLENDEGFVLYDLEQQTQEAYLAHIKEFVDANPEEEVYLGFGWLDSAFIGGTPTKEMLDSISNKPIYVKSEDCHSCWINSAMLELTGVDSTTEDPIGGVIEHDANGEPNGCFRDTAMDYYVNPFIPNYTVEQYKEILNNSQIKMAQNGYTAYDDIIIDPVRSANICEAYYQLDKEGLLKTKVNAAILIHNTPECLTVLEGIANLRDKYSDAENFRISDIKIFMDGIVESKTACVTVPYVGTNDTGDDRWPTANDVKRLNDLTKNINDKGFVAHFHAIGDKAITKAIDAIEYAQKNSTNKNIRNAITHLQMINDNDIQRLSDLGIFAVSNLGWAPSSNEEVGNENIELLNVGQQRNDAMYPFQTMISKGVYMSYATDYPAGPILHPIYNVEAGVTRQVFDYASTLRNFYERISLDDALDIMTRGGAYQLNREDEIGSLEVGKSADFVILNQDMSEIDPIEICDKIRLLQTYINGELMYERPDITSYE